jgi:hypothetical protein
MLSRLILIIEVMILGRVDMFCMCLGRIFEALLVVNNFDMCNARVIFRTMYDYRLQHQLKLDGRLPCVRYNLEMYVMGI